MSITITTVKAHCRTCLVRIGHEAAVDPDEEQGCKEDMGVEISNNLRCLFLKHVLSVDMESVLQKVNGAEYPPLVCFNCYSQLQEFAKFRRLAKQSARKLQLLFSGAIPEINVNCATVLAEKQAWEDDGESGSSSDVYKLSKTNSLMETESVLLEERIASPVMRSVDIDHEDPFETVETTSKASEKAVSGDEAEESEERENHNCASTDDKDASESMSGIQRELKTKLHRGKQPKKIFKCSQCIRRFAHQITLDAHIRGDHEGNKRPFKCDRCDKAYTFIGGLYTHIREIHDAPLHPYTCDHPGCDRIYTSFIAMQKHKRTKHTDSLPQRKYVCEICGATFNQSGNLKYHHRTKHPTLAEQAELEQAKQHHQCDICQKTFHSYYTLKYHTLQLHNKMEAKFECRICGRRVAKKFMLAQHMLIHSAEKTPCEMCGKQFIRKFELESHIRAVHLKLKPFECPYCNECFASRKTLRHHEFIHTGEKPYVCDVCGHAYRQQTCLKKHKNSHGPVPPAATETAAAAVSNM